MKNILGDQPESKLAQVREQEEPRDLIEVWQPADLPRIELRKGFGVARPVPRHWHEEYQLCLIQSGGGHLSYRGANLATPPASLFVVHPGEVHSNQAFDDLGCSYRTVFFDVETVREAALEIGRLQPGAPFFPEAVLLDRQIIGKYLKLHGAFEQPASQLERHALLLDFLTAFVFRFAENKGVRREPRFGKESAAVLRARDYLAEHFAENSSLKTLAAIANLSPFHFSRVFTAHFGVPPHIFQTQLRVLRARKLLQSGAPIAEAAFQAGFADQSHLNRHFKRLTAVTPGQFIKNSKNVQDTAA